MLAPTTTRTAKPTRNNTISTVMIMPTYFPAWARPRFDGSRRPASIPLTSRLPIHQPTGHSKPHSTKPPMLTKSAASAWLPSGYCATGGPNPGRGAPAANCGPPCHCVPSQ